MYIYKNGIMEQNQKSHATSHNHYPNIFNEIVSIGCSTGLKCDAFHKIYYLESKIAGNN